MKTIDHYLNAFKQDTISRRSFLKHTAQLGISLSAAGMLLNSPKRALAGSQTPRRGGTLKVAWQLASPNDTIDPMRTVGDLDTNRVMQLYNTLVSMSPDMKPMPALAESWEPVSGADDWVFHLRKGVEFHDGRPFTAKDVVYSINRVKDPKNGSGGAPLYADIVELKAENKHTLRIKLQNPNADLPVLFSEYHGHIIPDEFTDFDHAVGTGPFKLKSFEPGVLCVTERNPNYFREGLPYVDRVETFAIPDKVARLNALLAGEIDLMARLDPRAVKRVEADPRAKVLATKAGLQIPFNMMCTKAPYDNPDVRTALKLLVDREKYLKRVYKGYGQIGNDQPIAPIFPYYCDDLPIRQYDPDKAKALLKKAGYLDHTFELNASDGIYGSVEGALIYSQMAAKAGVKVKPVRRPTDGYWDSVWMKEPFSAGNWNTRQTENMMLTIGYNSDAPWNDTFWKRPAFDKLLLEARATVDDKKRTELYCAMQRMIHEDGGLLLPVFPDYLDAGSKKVHITLHPMASLGGWNFHETAWKEA